MARGNRSSAPAVPSRPQAWAAKTVARHHRNRAFRAVAALCRRYLAWYGNNNFDIRTNGETFLLRALSAFRPQVLIDVGANVGDWTLAARELCPGAEIHALEIAGPTFETLLANLRDQPRIRARNVGLSDAPGSVRLRHYADFPALTTSTDYPHPFAHEEIEGRVATGDSYLVQEGIGHVDILKIDVEGMEEPVLRGFREAFARKAVDVVQFEYGRVSVFTRFLLRDFHAFFSERGYVVGKLFPDHVDFRAYDLRDEDFIGSNFVACSVDRADYRDALAGRSGTRSAGR